MTPDSNLLYPLNEFYEQSGLPLPAAVQVAAGDVPEPYRSLLVHTREMTPTLEGAYRRSIVLRVRKYALRHNVLSREVVLVAGTAMAVAFCAIKIYLEHFPSEAKRLVLERKQPLGTILHTQGMAHSSHPEAYFQVAADAVIRGALDLKEPGLLYGRQNLLLDSAQRSLARVVEILPPSHPASANGHD
jgi:chorismate-pyruvate lyase